MLSFIANLAIVLSTLVIVGGFLALGILFVFELAAMLVFWLENGFDRDSKDRLGGPPGAAPARS